MALGKLQETINEYSSGGCRDLSDIPLTVRKRLQQLASESFETALKMAKDKKTDSPEYRLLSMVSKMINGEWN